ncbi:hypothetical protein [Thermoclostridium caenicola]|uniref:Uncharacterized protein n=1 Tax=Thermoclostridium caenicola TaxID=659425 RepID=A0A1M6KIQ0_9FIRM|nr:hypothetical protein [Thermoclostridium caenicola]SHJ58823.1 hypothetical protein SAMN05444373_10815 [Thermoclostridium caenicola]
MSDAVLVAIISGGAAVLSSIITGLITGGKTIYRIEQLEKKVDKHNNLVERMAIVERDIKTAFRLLDERRG